jgi:hypothetical protein
MRVYLLVPKAPTESKVQVCVSEVIQGTLTAQGAGMPMLVGLYTNFTQLLY